MIECPKCKRLFADEKAENSFDLNIPLIECTKCGFKFEYAALYLAGERPNCCGYSYYYFDKRKKKVYKYSEWPGSADDAATYTDEKEMNIQEGVEYLEKYYPEAKEAIDFLKSLKNV